MLVLGVGGGEEGPRNTLKFPIRRARYLVGSSSDAPNCIEEIASAGDPLPTRRRQSAARTV